MIKTLLSRALQVATTIAALVTSALTYPASLSHWPRLVILLAYLIALLCIRPNRPSKVAVIVSCVLALGSGFFYWVSLDSRSIQIGNTIQIKGDLTPEAQKYLKEHPSQTEKDYYWGIGTDEKAVWTAESIQKNKLVLGGLYSLFVFCSGFTIIGALEIIARLNRKTTTTAKKPAEKHKKAQSPEDPKSFHE